MNTITPFEQLINLSGKTAIVTGGAMGIGLGIVNRLAEAGANILLVDQNEAAAQSASEVLQKKGFRVAYVQADVSKEEDTKRVVDVALENFNSIDILVNNAGIYPNVPVLSMEPELFEKIISVNLKSVFLLTKSVAQVMIKQGNGGKIINISSIDAIHPSAVGLAAYDASKHAVWGFTKNTALELAPHRISVNAVAPGAIATPGASAFSDDAQGRAMHDAFVGKIPMKRIGEPDDVGKVVLFLASDLASYVTGSQIVVDGGILLA